MSGLAKYLLSCGKKVGGTDVQESEFTQELIELGADISIGADAGSVENYELIIYTDAVNDNNPRLKEAERLSKTVISRGQFLYEISRNFKKVIAVSGCHGKTTCVSMITHIFASAGKKFASHIGGRDITYKNFFYNGNDYFITEACEYRKNFLLLKPNIAVVLNTDADHIECYGSEEALRRAYLNFADGADLAITLYRDMPVSYGLSFGFDKASDYYAKDIKCNGGRYSFTVYEGGSVLGNISLKIFGKHNVLNALASIAVARSAGIEFNRIKEGLELFEGVERRFEQLGYLNGCMCLADYAHHPKELRAIIRTAQKLTEGKLFVVFQPHTYSRTKNLFKQFVKVLAPLNNLIIVKTYAAREYYDDAGSALTLSNALKKSRYADDGEDIKKYISKAEKNDLILFLGAGDIYYTAKHIVSEDK